MSNKFKIPSPGELLTERVTDYEPRIEAMCRDLVGQLRKSERMIASERDIPEVISAVALRMADAGWRCKITVGGARDNGKTNSITVYPPCGRCDGTGRMDKGGYGEAEYTTCTGCNGKGYRE